MKKKTDIHILDTTLRDGSYAINFNFSAQDTSIICKKLEMAGLNFIEIGHGVGLNASNTGNGLAFESDVDYMIAASESLSSASYGFFCIPGIANLSDIDILADHGGGFIRIGTNVTDIECSYEYIKRAKDNGLFVSSNFMKSYALPPEKFAEKVVISEGFGSDLVYLVDSSGGMIPSVVEKYYQAIKKKTDCQLGFHGHNNLGCAVANSLRAAELGFSFIDASIQGLGRSAGNAPLELLTALLDKYGWNSGIDLLTVIEIGQQYIRPLLSNSGIMPLDIISGYADFHSSYMKYIHKFSTKYSINPLLLIINYSMIDKVNMNEKELENLAQKMNRDPDTYLGKFKFSNYYGNEQDNI